MARIHGRSGKLYVGIASDTAVAEAVAYIAKISLNFETDDVEVTALGDTNKTYVSGLPDCSGSFSGFYDDATAQTYTAATDGLARRFYWYPKTPSTAGPYWFGTGIFDFSVDTGVADAATISGTFKAASPVVKVG
jgi:hypothetical protein